MNDRKVFLEAYGVTPDMSLKDYVMQLPKDHKARIEYEDQRHQPMILVRRKEAMEFDMTPGKIMPIEEMEVTLMGGFDWYEEAAMRTASGPTAESDKTYLDTAVLGLCGESGEIAEHIKKWRYHGHEFDPKHVAKELGDILWYVACGCRGIGFTMKEVAEMNIEKLAKRYGEKFSVEASLKRAECAHNVPLTEHCAVCAENGDPTPSKR